MMKKNILSFIGKALLALAPMITNKTACLGLWGEPAVPKTLKKS